MIREQSGRDQRLGAGSRFQKGEVSPWLRSAKPLLHHPLSGDTPQRPEQPKDPPNPPGGTKRSLRRIK